MHKIVILYIFPRFAFEQIITIITYQLVLCYILYSQFLMYNVYGAWLCMVLKLGRFGQ
jgi:hypothetical protein